MKIQSVSTSFFNWTFLARTIVRNSAPASAWILRVMRASLGKRYGRDQASSRHRICCQYFAVSSPAKGKSPRRSRSMKTVTERQRTGDESARFHSRQTCATFARSPWPRWLNICVSISSGSWSHISQYQLGPSSSLRGWGGCRNLVRFSCPAPRYRLDRHWKSHDQFSRIREMLNAWNCVRIEVADIEIVGENRTIDWMESAKYHRCINSHSDLKFNLLVDRRKELQEERGNVVFDNVEYYINNRTWSHRRGRRCRV